VQVEHAVGDFIPVFKVEAQGGRRHPRFPGQARQIEAEQDVPITLEVQDRRGPEVLVSVAAGPDIRILKGGARLH